MTAKEKVLAATLVEYQKFEIREYPMPEIAADSGLLKVERCGVCGSDYHGGWGRAPMGPKIMGHEIVGRIAKLGSAAARRWNVKEGDLVALEEYMPCGQCDICRSGYPRFCRTRYTELRLEGERALNSGHILWYGSAGVDIAPSLWGGYGQYVYLHPDAIVHKVPEPVELNEIAFFLPLSNGFEWACNYGGADIGKSIFIQGPGQQGLACTLAAKMAGASCIIVSGLSKDAHRMEIAKKLGADYTINVDKEDSVERVMEITGGLGVDTVVNVTGGGQNSIDDAVKVAGFNSVLVVAGAGEQRIDTRDVGRKNFQVKWGNGHSYKSVEMAIEVIASKKFPIHEITTHHFGIDDVAMAIKSVGGEGLPGAIHVSVNPWA